MNTFKPSAGALNVTVTDVSVAYKLPGDGAPDILLSHLGTVAGEHIYFKFGGSNVAAAVPAFNGTVTDDASALAQGSIQTRRAFEAGGYIAVISPVTGQKLSIETGLGG
jgi:hypothetical protein